MADFTEVDAQAFDTLGLRVLRGRGIDPRDVAGRPLGGRDQPDVRGSSFPRQESHRPGHPRLDRLGRSAGHDGRAAGTADRRRRRRRRLSRATSPRCLQSSTCRSASISASTAARMSGCTRVRCSLVRAAGDPLVLVRSITTRSRSVDKDQTAARLLDHEIRCVRWSPSVTTVRFLTSLFAVFGTLAVLLAMVGVYGVMSWVVGQRTTEFGIRMALGAEPAQVVAHAAGAVAPAGRARIWCSASAGGFGLGKVLNSMFWELTAPEPAVLAGTAALMLAAALSAAWVPMRRVLTLDPNRVLRDE